MVPACGASKRAAPESSARSHRRARGARTRPRSKTRRGDSERDRKRGVSPHRHRARQRHFAEQLLALRVDCLLPKELGRHRDRIMAAESASANYAKGVGVAYIRTASAENTSCSCRARSSTAAWRFPAVDVVASAIGQLAFKSIDHRVDARVARVGKQFAARELRSPERQISTTGSLLLKPFACKRRPTSGTKSLNGSSL